MLFKGSILTCLAQSWTSADNTGPSRDSNVVKLSSDTPWVPAKLLKSKEVLTKVVHGIHIDMLDAVPDREHTWARVLVPVGGLM